MSDEAWVKSYVLIHYRHKCRCGAEHFFEVMMGVVHSGRRPFRVLVKPGQNIYDLPIVREMRVSTTEACGMCVDTTQKTKLPESFASHRPPQNAPKPSKEQKITDLLNDLGL